MMFYAVLTQNHAYTETLVAIFYSRETRNEFVSDRRSAPNAACEPLRSRKAASLIKSGTAKTLFSGRGKDGTWLPV